MSTHGNIKQCGNLDGLRVPEIEEDGVCIEINVPEFLWADDEAEAIAFLDKVIKNAQIGKRRLRSGRRKRKKTG